MPNLTLQAEGLALRYQRRPIWQLPDLAWQEGELIWLQGENGSGKTSLMKIISGLQQPTSGQVRLLGAENARLAAGQVCCYLHQQPYLFNASVRRNLEIALYSKTLQHTLPEAPDKAHTRLEAALAWAELDGHADQPARTLSGGERQRLALARARLVQPRFWLLDEPAASLDDAAIRLLARLIEDLQQQGCGILLTAHQQSQVTDLCRKRWLLADQQLTLPQYCNSTC